MDHRMTVDVIPTRLKVVRTRRLIRSHDFGRYECNVSECLERAKIQASKSKLCCNAGQTRNRRARQTRQRSNDR